MIKRLCALCVALVFIAGCYFALAPMAAELYAGQAARLEKMRKLDSAMAAYRKALRLDALNAKYYGEIGRLYLKKAGRVADTGLRTDSKNAYAKAIDLSPTNSKYRIGWGSVEALLLSDKKAFSDGELAAYVDNFKKAVELAPNDYYVNAVSGYYILVFRNRISAKDRNFAIYRLRYSLELNPRYADQIFSYVANGLGDFRVLEKITPQTPYWQGRLRKFLRNIDKWKYRRP